MSFSTHHRRLIQLAEIISSNLIQYKFESYNGDQKKLIWSRYSHMNLSMVANRNRGVRTSLGDSYRGERTTVFGAIPMVAAMLI